VTNPSNIITTLPSPLPRITELIKNKEPVSVVTRTHGVWDCLFCRHAYITGKRSIPGQLARVLRSWNEHLWHQIINDINSLQSRSDLGKSHFEGLSFANHGRQILPNLSDCGRHDLSKYKKTFKYFGILDSVTNFHWYDAAMFKEGICNNSFADFFSSFIWDKRIVIVAPPHRFNHLKKQWKNKAIKIISTEYPRACMTQYNGREALRRVTEAVHQDISQANEYTIYLMQGGTGIQRLIHKVLDCSTNHHALIDIGMALDIFFTPGKKRWGGQPPKVHPWMTRRRKFMSIETEKLLVKSAGDKRTAEIIVGRGKNRGKKRSKGKVK